MSEQPEALRLADALEGDAVSPIDLKAAAELRRLHAENTALAAALASSCDEQRHQLWESGGIAGCERARVAERQRDALLEALKMWLHLHDTPAGYVGKYGKALDAAIAAQQVKIDAAANTARAAIAAVEGEKT